MCIYLKRSILAFFAACLAWMPLSAKDFVVGTATGYAPFVSLDEKGNYVGFDIDIAKELSKKLNRNLVIKDLGSVPSLFLALKQNKIDVIIWAISITQERQKQMDMVYYQGQKVTSLPLLFWKKIPDGVVKVEDISPKQIICVEAGSFQESVLQKVPGINLKQVDKVMDAVLEIKYGKAQATMIDPGLVFTICQQFPEIQLLNIPLPPSEQSLGNGICINKDNQLLSQQVQQAVAELQSEGTIGALEKQYNLVGQ